MSTNEPSGKVYFEVRSCLGVNVRVTEDYWTFMVTVKHPPMRGHEDEVKQAIGDADQVRVSKIDSAVHLYYRKGEKRYICVVVRHLDGDGFIISAYPTDAI